MITLTKLKKDGNDETFILNCDMIELIEENPTRL